MKESKGVKFLIAIVIILIIICIALIILRIVNQNKPTTTTISQDNNEIEQPIEEPKKQPVTFTGNERKS